MLLQGKRCGALLISQDGFCPTPPVPASTVTSAQMTFGADTIISSGGSAPSVEDFPMGYIGRLETVDIEATYPATEFRLTAPEIPAEDRDAADLVQSPMTIQIAIPKDTLTLAAV